MIYGVRYSTDSRDRYRLLVRFQSREQAITWRDTQGPKGVGQSFGPDNGHRYVREVYELHGRQPAGSRLIALMERGRCSRDEAWANYVMDKGSVIK